MTLVEKLSLLDLNEKENKKAKEKFMVTLSLISEDELKKILDLLAKEDIKITKANQIKTLANSEAELSKCFSILKEIHHQDIYKQDVNMLNRNVIDLHRMITYYDQNGISYRDENGEYDLKKFTEKVWKEISSKSIEEELKIEPLEEEKTRDVVSFDNFSFPTLENAQKELDEIDEKRESLENMKSNLENQLDNILSFDDLEPESFGIGGRAA